MKTDTIPALKWNSLVRFLAPVDDLPQELVQWQDGQHEQFRLVVFGMKSEPMPRTSTEEAILDELHRLRRSATILTA